MKTFVAWFIIGTFAAANLIIVVYSLCLSIKKQDELITANMTPPSLPSFPKEIYNIKDTLNAKIQASRYAQHVQMYQKHLESYASHLTAYTKYIETKNQYRTVEVYKLVVKDTLAPFVTAVTSLLAAFAFATTGVQALNNYFLVKNNRDPNPISFF